MFVDRPRCISDSIVQSKGIDILVSLTCFARQTDRQTDRQTIILAFRYNEAFVLP